MMGLAGAAFALARVAYAGILVTASVVDMRTRRIPNRLIIYGLILIWLMIPLGLQPAFQAIVGMLAGGAIMLAIALAGRGGMGAGDVKFAVVVGGFAGWPGVLIVLFTSFTLAAISGVVLIVLGIKSRKDYIPFAPFLSLGAIIALVWGDWLLIRYRGI